jgi:TRAP transporter TAXI family solute receptor
VRGAVIRVALAATMLLAALAAAHAAVPYRIATAGERGTYFAVGRDLARLVAPGADMELEVLATPGSATNVRMLRDDPSVRLAIVQADVLLGLAERRAEGHAEAAALVRPVRVILPLYDTEVHYVVRADSPMRYIHDIRDARINGGPVGSGAALLTHTAYRMMFGAPIPPGNALFLSAEDALVRLVTDRSVDVVVIAAGQPAPLLAGMKPEARQHVKFLALDPRNARSAAALKAYSAVTVRAASYPNLIGEDFTTLAVGAYLVTRDFADKDVNDELARFGRVLCDRFDALQTRGHPKWREVELNLRRLPAGLVYSEPTSREIRACLASDGPRRARPKPMPACTPEEKLLGLCR